MRPPRHVDCMMCEDGGVIMYREIHDGSVVKLEKALACSCRVGQNRAKPGKDKAGNVVYGMVTFNEFAHKYRWKPVPIQAGSLAVMKQRLAEFESAKGDGGEALSAHTTEDAAPVADLTDDNW